MVNQGYINHVGLVLDASGSMNHLKSSTIKVADLQVQTLATRSTEMDQETRATIYQFDTHVDCLYYDKDVLRLPSIKNLYRIGGQTALIDAVMKAIEDLEKTATLYGDHAFLLYVLTDGMENASRKHSAYALQQKLARLPDNWTVAVFVPDATGVFEAKKLGFAPGNIAIWNPSAEGIAEVGRKIEATTTAYMHSRTTGMRSTTGLFDLSTENLTPQTVRGNLLPVPKDRYGIYSAMFEQQIRDFVEAVTHQKYRVGSAFYELVKPEKVQASKQVMVRERATGNVYSGHEARKILGLPNYEVRVDTAAHPGYDIFIQSTSVNRKLVPGQEVIVVER